MVWISDQLLGSAMVKGWFAVRRLISSVYLRRPRPLRVTYSLDGVSLKCYRDLRNPALGVVREGGA
jgi:hypothetical protein